MKTKPLTFLLSLTFLFLYPSISLSQTFKCEFIQERFKGGKTNEGSCSGNPEIVFSTEYDLKPRNKHCEVDDYSKYFSRYLIDYRVDLDNKIISYKDKTT